MRHSTTLPELLGTNASRRAFLKRVVVMGAAIPAIVSVLAACGDDEVDDDAPVADSDAEPTATAASAAATEAPGGEPTSAGTDATAPAGTATTAASPTVLESATQPPSTAGSGQLAFAGLIDGAPASAVYLVGSEGAGPHAVWGWPTAGSHAMYLVWSPDSRYLAFYAHDAGLDAASGGYSALFWLAPDQGQTSNLNLAGLLDIEFVWGSPTWSPDGRLLYVSLPPPSDAPADVNPDEFAGILAIPVDGSAAPTWLITLQELDMQNPTLRLSPDGQMIAAMVGVPPQLVVLRVDDPQMRVAVGELTIGGFPVWSPDSRQIAFNGLSVDGIGQLYVVNADGTGLSQLTDHQPPDGVVSGGPAADPAWSPDGQQIAYTVLHDGTQQVYVSAVDGSDTRNLSNGPEYAHTGPSWSPDGREIAFVSQPVDAWRVGEEPLIRDIRVIMADGTDPRIVVAGVQGVEFEPFDMQLTGLPAWRPTAP